MSLLQLLQNGSGFGSRDSRERMLKIMIITVKKTTTVKNYQEDKSDNNGNNKHNNIEYSHIDKNL